MIPHGDLDEDQFTKKGNSLCYPRICGGGVLSNVGSETFLCHIIYHDDPDIFAQ